MKKYTREIVEEAVKNSFTKKECLGKLGMFQGGQAYAELGKYIKLYNIDDSHFLTRSQIIKNCSDINRRYSLEEIMIENSNYSKTYLKKRLYDVGLKKRECELCGQGEIWRGKKMSLIIDHINGINNDHRLFNLRIVCPNCNSTLDTHCVGNKNKK